MTVVTNIPITEIKYTGTDSSPVYPRGEVKVVNQADAVRTWSMWWAVLLVFLAVTVIVYLFLIWRPPTWLQTKDATGKTTGQADTLKCALAAVVCGLIAVLIVLLIYYLFWR